MTQPTCILCFHYQILSEHSHQSHRNVRPHNCGLQSPYNHNMNCSNITVTLFDKIQSILHTVKCNDTVAVLHALLSDQCTTLNVVCHYIIGVK